MQVDKRPAERAGKPRETGKRQPDARATSRPPQVSRRPEPEQQHPDDHVEDRKRLTLHRAGRNFGADPERSAGDRKRDRQRGVPPLKHRP